ncbi:MAG: ATP-dependent Clp protease ATP-binding subunit ClpX, partial [Candidatus Dormibacteraceae bacterium]
EHLIERRIGRHVIGFGDKGKRPDKREQSEILAQLQTEDLLKYGFIPEFIGRLPIVVDLQPLDESDIVRILTEPKNALVKQYQKFFGLDSVELVFEPAALQTIAELAMGRGTGARALKSIIEEVLLEPMFEIPSRSEIRRCTITPEAITAGMPPAYELGEDNSPRVVRETA